MFYFNCATALKNCQSWPSESCLGCLHSWSYQNDLWLNSNHSDTLFDTSTRLHNFPSHRCKNNLHIQLLPS